MRDRWSVFGKNCNWWSVIGKSGNRYERWSVCKRRSRWFIHWIKIWAMAYVESFRELDVYKLSRELSKEIFEVSKKFPKEGAHGSSKEVVTVGGGANSGGLGKKEI